jgi:hypothetical protein
LFAGLVEDQDRAGFVDDDDAVDGDVENAGQTGFGDRQ